VSPRAYDLGRRRDQIAQNRRRVLDAARFLLGEPTAYTAFTVDAIAKQADVARATIYYQFGSKTGVLEALCDELAEAGELTRLGEVFGEPDPRQALHLFVGAFARFWATDRPVTRRLRALATLDPEVGAVIDARDERRRAGLSVLIGRLGSSAPQLQQLLYTLTSFETFDSLAGPSPDPGGAAALVVQLAGLALTLPPQAEAAAEERPFPATGATDFPSGAKQQPTG
jgi:AcrR family transcriptional regulator